MKRWQWSLLFLSGALGLALQVLGSHPAHAHWWDAVPGAYGVFGFAGCALIIFASKWAGKVLLLRREDYYDDR